MPPVKPFSHQVGDPGLPAGFCAGCGYELRGLAPGADSSYRCPECGRVFYPANPKTFHAHPHGRLVRWLSTPIGWPTMILAFVAVAGILSVSRWKPNSFKLSCVDFVFYLNPSALRHRTNLLTWRDWVYTLSALAIIAAMAWWALRTILSVLIQWQLNIRPEQQTRRIHTGRRHALMLLCLVAAATGIALGWPYRLARHWIAEEPVAVYDSIANFPPTLDQLPPPNLTDEQTLLTLRAAVMQMPTPRQRATGLKFLMDAHPEWALPILLEAVAVEGDWRVRVLELHLIGLHRDVKTVNLMREFMKHADSQTRAAAADAIGLIHKPAWQPWGLMDFDGQPEISLSSKGDWGELGLNLDEIELDPAIRAELEKIMLSGPTLEEREAAARALVTWPPENYSLRVAEWGVWLNDDGKLKLVKSILDEMPPFVHRAGNPLSEFQDRVETVIVHTKPILHIMVDHPMALDVNVVIQNGRPWLVYPRPDDFAENTELLYEPRTDKDPSWGTPKALSPLDNPSLDKLSDLRQEYPWLSPKHPISLYGTGSKEMNGDLTGLGVRWQSIIASPTPLSWMALPDVGSDPRFAWWKRLRDVPCSYVSSRGESERFLYYDGPTLSEPPVDATWEGKKLNLTLQAANKTTSEFPRRWNADTPQGQLLIHHKSGKLSAQAIEPPFDWNARNPVKSFYYTVIDDPLHDQQVIAEFDRMIQKAGLSPGEAGALIGCWSPQFFQSDGSRLLTIISRADYDAYCPIQIRPTPTQLVRVGVVLTEFPP